MSMFQITRTTASANLQSALIAFLSIVALLVWFIQLVKTNKIYVEIILMLGLNSL